MFATITARGIRCSAAHTTRYCSASLTRSTCSTIYIPSLTTNRCRGISTARDPSTTVSLNFEQCQPATLTENASPLVILHGLFGSKQNWRSLARNLAQRLSTNVYALDLRNHGDSPQHSDMSYSAMSADVMRFLQEHRIANATLLGHSMGARVAMTLALDRSYQMGPHALKRLVLVDMSPREIAIQQSFGGYVEAMQAVERANVARQSEADAILQERVPELGVRQFLLTNLKRATDDPNGYRFRIPLDVIAQALPTIGRFQLPAQHALFNAPTLVIAGSRSEYVTPKDHDLIHALFPQAMIEYLDAGHWVHAEKPSEFTRLVSSFCQQYP